MMVIDEAFDCWNLGKNDDDYHLYFNDWWKRDIDSMLLRDRNHPSVIFWSIGNEIDGRRTPEGVAIAKQLHDEVKSIDPCGPSPWRFQGRTITTCRSGRRTTRAFSTWTWAATTISGSNMRSTTSAFPQRIMMGTESFPIRSL